MAQSLTYKGFDCFVNGLLTQCSLCCSSMYTDFKKKPLKFGRIEKILFLALFYVKSLHRYNCTNIFRVNLRS